MYVAYGGMLCGQRKERRGNVHKKPLLFWCPRRSWRSSTEHTVVVCRLFLIRGEGKELFGELLTPTKHMDDKREVFSLCRLSG
jgi:hypothetical protein